MRLARVVQRQGLEGVVARRPISSPSRRRGRSRTKVAARLPSAKGGQVSRSRAPREHLTPGRLFEKTRGGPKVAGLSPFEDPRGFAPTGAGGRVMTTADDFDDFDDFDIDVPFDEDTDESTEYKR